MASDIELASNALILIGDNPISSFTEPGAGATAAANLYEDTYRVLLSLHPWTFAFKEQKLNKLSQSPDSLTNFSSAFQMPTDHIRTWAMMPQSNYAVVGDKIYSNENELLLRYVYKVAETMLPPHFTKTLEYLLASDFAQLVTENTSKSEYFKKLYKDQLGSAMSIDSSGHPQVAILDRPFTDVRYGGFAGGF